MTLPEGWNSLPTNQRLTHLAEVLHEGDPVLAAMVEQLMPSIAGPEGEHRRALLDAYLAVLAAKSADTHAQAAKTAAEGLKRATWALVIVPAYSSS